LSHNLSEHTHLGLAFTPYQLATLALPNRLVVAPMSRVSTPGDGVPTRQMAEYYRRFIEGRFGLVITEGIYPIGPAAQGYTNQPGLTSIEHVKGWRQVTDAVHECGGHIIAQLMHAGALSQHFVESTLAPSVIVPKGRKMPEYGGAGRYPVPRAATADDIADIIDGFAASAFLAEQAGFDGLEVHAANGYLLDQFITDYTNTRTDHYGGSASARARLTGEVTAAVIESVAGRLPVGVRLSQAKVNDAGHRWLDGSEAQEIFTTIAASSPAYLHLAGEGRPWTQSGKTADGTALGALARHATGLPVIANGGLHTAALINQVLNEGEADLISLGRPALADPGWPVTIAAGRTPEPFDATLITPSASLDNSENARTRCAVQR
jgi:2,4-dienoyl-CoA reductase-like NADH-dependent reductase (Old Yellow Enzyme family)